MKQILAIDQGTTGTTTLVIDQRGRIVDRAYRPFPQIYPQPGWVEHDPEAIWQTVVDTVREICGRNALAIVAVGITNQRETTVVWDRRTGAPVHNAIVWQCRRTADICRELRHHQALFRERTGLPMDAYFSGTKLTWLLRNAAPENVGDLAFGTIDSWLLWKLTGGKRHATDVTNASRTLMFDIRRKVWDEQLCGLLGVPTGMLPEVRPSGGEFGAVSSIPELQGVPVLAIAGDQQAALYGQGCFGEGEVKNTYGTGCFVIMNTGPVPVHSEQGLLTTLAVAADGSACYALEGSVFIAGAAIQWLRDELGLIADAAESDAIAVAAGGNNGVYFVPAFVGLGAPHWDMEARGVLVGLTRGTSRDHLIRAALESMAYQTLDVLLTMEDETGITIPKLAVDGGAAANNFLMQFQADILSKPIERPELIESTAIGAAYLAGLHAGVWANAAELKCLRTVERVFDPSMDTDARDRLLAGWRHALRQAMTK